jgi:hypothetical protein
MAASQSARFEGGSGMKRTSISTCGFVSFSDRFDVCDCIRYVGYFQRHFCDEDGGGLRSWIFFDDAGQGFADGGGGVSDIVAQAVEFVAADLLFSHGDAL